MNKVLEVKNLTKKFKQFTAVDDVSFDLGQGEILGLLGPNGAGKTTTIQMILGVLTPTAGTVCYFGQDLKTHRSEIMEQVNFSSTYINLPWMLSVREALTFFSLLYRIPDRKKRLTEIESIFDLKDLLRKKIGDLSTGQLTRVNLAKALLNRPKVLLLDEPTASLDPETARYIRDFLLANRTAAGVSVILTSHNMPEVEEVCDRIIFLQKGKIIADDTPANLARSLQIAHLELFVPENAEEARRFCAEMGLPAKMRGKYLLVAVPEEKIPDFLKSLQLAGIKSEEVSIRKPSLEDYFLEIAARQKENI